MFNWVFENFIYVPDGNDPLQKTHAQLPTPLLIGNSVFRFYFSSRDDLGRSRPFFLDYCMAKRKVLFTSEMPILELGAAGAFDDCGIMPSSIIQVDDKHYLYYIGWNQRKNISYQLAIGLAVSSDGGQTFAKYSQGPILDRSIHDPIFCAAPCVHRNGTEYIMWYISATGWPRYRAIPEPVYLIKRAESKDGINWKPNANVSVAYEYEGEALGRPWVVNSGAGYHMWYSSRGSNDYRSAEGQHYRIGYASSDDGKTWERKDDKMILTTSGKSWDRQMQEYSAIFEYAGDFYMIYNGNTFGKEGFGLARLHN